MANKLSGIQGCLLGMAVGDAMGFPVDRKILEDIYADYGPNGLLGYDLVNGSAEVTSHTQVAAYVSNGLLLGVSRGKKDMIPYITLSLREWARNQQFYRDPEISHCWVAKPKELRLHNNRDARMLDTLRAQTLGTPEQPINQHTGPGGLTAAVAIGLFYDPRRMAQEQLVQLAARTVALTHGSPETILAGAVLAAAVADVLCNPEKPLQEVFCQALGTVRTQYAPQFPLQTELLSARLRLAMELAQDPDAEARGSMERLACDNGPSCLAGAVYACLTSGDDFDTALITAVNHSGLSAAVGAVTGAVMGARLGAEALPAFYLESLTAAQVLSELATDLAQGSLTTGLFDDDWDHKYMQGLPLGEPAKEKKDTGGLLFSL